MVCEHCGAENHHPSYACDQMECDYCSQKGHTFRSCPKRDDNG